MDAHILDVVLTLGFYDLPLDLYSRTHEHDRIQPRIDSCSQYLENEFGFSMKTAALNLKGIN